MIQKKFQEFRKTITKSQFNSAFFLKQKVAELKDTDPGLAQRIETRIKHLNARKSKAVIQSTQDNDSLPSAPQQSPLEGSAEKGEKGEKDEKAEQRPKKTLLELLSGQPMMIIVVIPVLLFSIYQVMFAAPRYESRIQVVVQQPDGMATMDAGMALLSGLGVNTTNSDTQLVSAYIYSNDMLQHLEEELNIREHFENNGDFFSRLHSWNTVEDFYNYFSRRVIVEISEKSHVITIRAQGFTPDFAHLLAESIASKAEWYINNIGHQLANAQLEFVGEEHKLVESRLQLAQVNLLNFQQRFNLLSPEAEGEALSKIAYELEAQIARKRAELAALSNVMSDSAPQVVVLKNSLSALESQLAIEKNRLTQVSYEGAETVAHNGASVSEVLAGFTELKIELELALKAYTSSTISLEKSRIEAYRQLKHLIVVESATKPEDSSYPEKGYNIALLTVILMLIYGVGKIIFATVRELK